MNHRPPTLQETAPFPRRRGTLANGLVVLTFAVLTLVITYPVVLQLGANVAQNPAWSRDALHHVYVTWWFKQALFKLGTSPANLQGIYFPAGGHYPLVLTYSMVYLPGALLALFLPPIAAYNLIFLLIFFLSGLTAYALCNTLTGNRWAGLLGGIIYAFFPAHVVRALSGHIELASIYLFPLYLLLMIKTFRRPRPATAVLCGLTLAGSLLIQPLYVPFLLVPFTLVWLLYEILVRGPRPERRTLVALGGAFGLGVALATPFYLPVLREQIGMQGSYLEDIGMVRFSADLLGILAPSALNPVLAGLGLVPGYVERVAPTDWRIAELLTYAGLVTLALAALAVVRRRRETGAWALVAAGAAVLSLGPLLKLNGRVVTFVTDGIETGVPLPYALLLRVPFLSLNRGPSRLNVTLMLALAVLAAYGLAWLLKRVRGRWRAVTAVVLCACALVDMLVIWPCPTTPPQVPAYLEDMAQQGNGGAVLNAPLVAGHVKEIGLFYQTVHRHPVFDCWFQRELPTFPNTAAFLDGLLNPPELGQDIVPTPTPGVRAAVARAEGTGYAFLFTHHTGSPEARMALLESEFGSPHSTEEGVAIYEVAPGPTGVDGPVYVLPNNDWSDPEHGWWYVEPWEDRPARWMAASAELYIYSPDRREGVLRFKALPLAAPRRLQIEVNQTVLSPLIIGQWITYTTPSFTLEPGINQINLRALEGCDHYVGDPRCSGVTRAAAGEGQSGCSRYLTTERCLAILLQQVHFTPTSGGPAGGPWGIDLGDRVRLLGYDLAGTPGRGQDWAVTLYWQARGPIEEDYVIFVHLLDEDGNLTAQHDGPPVEGIYPTSRWVTGDLFTQQIILRIPEDVPPGIYDLLAGMYSYPDLIRLPVTGNRPYARDGLVWLEEVKIE